MIDKIQAEIKHRGLILKGKIYFMRENSQDKEFDVQIQKCKICYRLIIVS